jgi:hypothetical protein
MKDKNFNATPLPREEEAQGREGRAGSPLPAARPYANDGAHGVTRPTKTTA